jgi:hypothetical protein
MSDERAPCPPCPKCWSASAVTFTAVTKSGNYCRCERCGTVWFHDADRIAAALRERESGDAPH